MDFTLLQGNFAVIETDKKVRLLVLEKDNWELIRETESTYVLKRITSIRGLAKMLQK